MAIRQGRERHDGTSDHGAALATLHGGGKIVIGWVESSAGGRIKFCVSEDGLAFDRSWCVETPHRSSAGVALASFGSRAVAAWVESPDDRRIRVIESEDGLAWSEPEILPERSKGNPALGVVLDPRTQRDHVCLAWTREEDERLCVTWKSSDANAWHAPVVLEVGSDKSPAVYGTYGPYQQDFDRLGFDFNLVYRRRGDGKVGITRIEVADDGAMAMGSDLLLFDAKTDRQPAVLPRAFFPGLTPGMFVAYRGRDEKLFFANGKYVFGGPNAGPDFKHSVPSDTCTSTPALGRLGDHLVEAWAGGGGPTGRHHLFTKVWKAPQ